MIKITVEKLIHWGLLLCIFSIIGIVIAMVAMNS
tara:strand:+ start:514 stop:615 length:102 start_codon:yes stop_codon:yes gene_type:complete